MAHIQGIFGNITVENPALIRGISGTYAVELMALICGRVAHMPWNTHTVAFIGNNASFDCFKLYDKNDNLLYVENFSNPTRPTKPDPALLCPHPPNCQTAFATYFNQKKGTSYIFN